MKDNLNKVLKENLIIKTKEFHCKKYEVQTVELDSINF